jgi:hypothetical protein
MRAFIHYPGVGKMVAALALLALTACASTVEYVPVDRPVYIERVRNVVAPLPAALLQPHPVAEGAPSQCLDVAAQRRAEIESCNADKAGLRLIQPEARDE